MTAVKGVVGAGRPRTVGSASRRGGKHQPLGSIEQDEDEERSRVLKTKLPLSLSLKQAWSTTSQDASPTADMKFDEFQKAWREIDTRFECRHQFIPLPPPPPPPPHLPNV